MNLKTDAELAEDFGLTLEKFHHLRKRHNWPHVKLGRFEYRFTEDQIQHIVDSSTVTPAESPTRGSGLTQRSARRAS